VTLCIRPETIQLSVSEAAGGQNSLQGIITNHIFEGALVRYWVEVGKREIIVDVFDPSDKGIFTGKVTLSVHPNKVHVLSSLPQESN
jgi:ABC-type Fe3+/spermidine/putrescine transport system ATPase subunit